MTLAGTYPVQNAYTVAKGTWCKLFVGSNAVFSLSAVTKGNVKSFNAFRAMSKVGIAGEKIPALLQ